ncbi:hypothetical protein J2Z57_001485 [Formosa algae]|uniref:Uncharacterized protein n=1 Tax=Formosa algae TaxID=225843 RepID=A0A9X0YHN9_9FLAO|nr:hypothetical protein [Formosa algae]MDQ0335039.1 hypothetical protein [Formosa algae]
MISLEMCVGDGIPEVTSIVDCESADAMMDEYSDYCN